MQSASVVGVEETGRRDRGKLCQVFLLLFDLCCSFSLCLQCCLTQFVQQLEHESSHNEVENLFVFFHPNYLTGVCEVFLLGKLKDKLKVVTGWVLALLEVCSRLKCPVSRVSSILFYCQANFKQNFELLQKQKNKENVN